MKNAYITIPTYTTINEILEKNYTLSATQHKCFNIKNKSTVKVEHFLERKLNRSDLGSEVGSESYVNSSKYTFIKTKALQEDSYLMSESKDSIMNIVPNNFVDMQLKKGDLIISKDSNVGEIVLLHEDLPNAMLCGGIYRMPIKDNKLYLLAFIKSELFRQQIDFLVPRGSTIRHGKTKFLECQIPLPNQNVEETIKYVELIMEAIINKEKEIRSKHKLILDIIEKELRDNQKDKRIPFTHPTINTILKLDRMDSCLYSETFIDKEALITNYKNGFKTIKQLGFNISRGQNLQISNIGKSSISSVYKENYYTLILPKYISKYGTIKDISYLGNSNKLKTISKGDIIFGAEGNEKGRSLAIVEEHQDTITNIHGITLNQKSHDLTKGIFVKLFLDYYRDKGMIDAYAVGGNGGSLAIKYWDFLKFPTFPKEKELDITRLYYNSEVRYRPTDCGLNDFKDYDIKYNQVAGIYDLDKALRYLKNKLNDIINDIANDKIVEIKF